MNDIKAKRRATVEKWLYRDRQLTIEVYPHAPNTLTFCGGNPFECNTENYSLKDVGRAQKNLRQKLYNYLASEGLNTDNYLLKVDGPTKPSGAKVFIDLSLMYEPSDINDLTSNKAICEGFFDELHTISLNKISGL